MQINNKKKCFFSLISWPRAANRYEKIVFVTKFGREYENTKVHPKSMILALYGTECYRHSFPTVKANTQHLF